MLAEANVLPETDMEYFGDDGERMHMMFNFQVNQHLFYALASADTRPLIKAMKATRPRPATAQWGLFLRNHDELDLGRLTKEQRQTVFEAFGPDESMQLYDRGIRRRLAPMLGGDRRRIELAYSLLFTLPGTPVIRYGDELGMGDDLSQKERNCARTPMQWSDEPHGGFTKHDKPVCPVISEGPYGFEHVNAAIQRRYPDSLLNWTERIIRMRKEVPEVGWGDFAVIPHAQPRDPGDAVRLAKQFGPLRPQLRCRSRTRSLSQQARRASMAMFSSTYLAPSTARSATMESITWSSRATAIAGTAWAGSTISCGARTSDDANACALSAAMLAAAQ